ncbi:MAG: glycosyltransferase [bacterium]
MKILVLSSQASNTGSALRAGYIAKYLKKAGAQVTYVRPPFVSLPFMLDFLLSLIYYFFTLTNSRYDIVFIVKPYPNTVWPALLLKKQGAKLVIDIDDLDHGYRVGFLSKVIEKIQKTLTEKADLLTSHNDALIKILESAHPKFAAKIYKLEQGVDFEVFKAEQIDNKKIGLIRQQFVGKKLLFYTAHLNIASYLDDIFEALKKIADKNVLLLVAGGGPLEKYYKKSARAKGLKDRVIFLGQLSRPEIATYIKTSDLCLVYYRDVLVNKYRASMKLREYLAMGKRVVAPAVGEINYFKKVVLLSGKNITVFAAVIKKNIYLVDKFNIKGQQLILNQYDWKKEAKEFYVFLKHKFMISPKGN